MKNKLFLSILSVLKYAILIIALYTLLFNVLDLKLDYIGTDEIILMSLTTTIFIYLSYGFLY